MVLVYLFYNIYIHWHIFFCVLKVFILVFVISNLSAEPTFINSFPYQDLWPEYFYYTYQDGVTNVIPAIGGGFLMTSFINPGYEFYEEPQTVFFKVSENGVMEWRKQDYAVFGYTYIRSIVSNGVDR